MRNGTDTARTAFVNFIRMAHGIGPYRALAFQALTSYAQKRLAVASISSCHQDVLLRRLPHNVRALQLM